MHLQLSEVQTQGEFKDVVTVEFEAYHQPLNSFWEILKGPSVDECAARQWLWHTATSDSHWLKVTDSETGQIVGGAEWIVHQANPYVKGPTVIQADWWPEGELKTMSDGMLAMFFNRRPYTMSRPHLLVNICFVSQSYRRHGAGGMMMKWGCKLADELGMEAFVEATEDGLPLYRAYGFVAVEKFHLQPPREGSANFKRFVDEILPVPYPIWLMWRPKGGKFEAGKTIYSWKE